MELCRLCGGFERDELDDDKAGEGAEERSLASKEFFEEFEIERVEGTFSAEALMIKGEFDSLEDAEEGTTLSNISISSCSPKFNRESSNEEPVVKLRKESVSNCWSLFKSL